MKRALQRFYSTIGSRGAFVTLLVANGLVALLMMWATSEVMLPDGWTYIALAEGLLHGEYSMWWRLGDQYPDTFRAPGYPLLVAGVMLLTGTWKGVAWLNLVLYAFALWAALELIKRVDARLAARNLFLLMLLPLLNVPYYINQVYTEIPALAGLGAILLLMTRPVSRPVWVAGLMGLLLGAMFLLKPVLQLLPLAIILGELLWNRGLVRWSRHLILLIVYGATMVPYGLWNLRQHGVFSTTPLEGPGGYMHFGAWCGKLPGYTERVYWQNFAADEPVHFVPEKDVPGYIAAYEAEWDSVNTELALLLEAKDSLLLASREAASFGATITYNTKYTRRREELLFGKAVAHWMKDPWYTAKYKAYSVVRLWIIGLQPSEFRKAGLVQKARIIYATFSTGLIFILFLVLIAKAFQRRAVTWRELWPMLAFMAYFGIMHLPFTIQVRYTTPVRFAMLAVMAIAATRLMERPLKAEAGASTTAE